MNVAHFFTTVLLVSSVSAAEKRNVLILNIDDLKPTLGCYGNSIAKSPHIDALAKKGTTMRHNYCQQAVCAASRVSFFTGLRPDYTGVQDLNTHMRDINPNVLTMPEHFKKNGYQSIGYGKILHGAKNDDPQSWTLRVQSSKLNYNSSHPAAVIEKYQSPKIHAFLQSDAGKKVKHNKGLLSKVLKNKKLNTATECLDIPDDAYPDGAITKDGCAKLKELANNKSPFFMVLGYQKPHLPFTAPKKYWDMYDRASFPLAEVQTRSKDRPEYAYHSFGELGNYSDFTMNVAVPAAKQRELIHGYYACVSYIDAQIGQVMKTLKETGLEKNTIVVLWGDHGWHLGDHGLWCKHSNMEQATAAPLLIVSPDGKPQQNYQHPTEFIDLFPTVCKFANIEVPTQVQGVDLIPVLTDPSLKLKQYSVSQYPRHNANGYTLRAGRYRVTYWMDKEYLTQMAFNQKRVKAIEIYDYETDPLEKINLVKRKGNEGLVKEMATLIEGFFAANLNDQKGRKMRQLMKQHSRKNKQH